jgi:hypothetical protein
MSDDLLSKSYDQLKSMEETLQRSQMVQSQGCETLQGLFTTDEAMEERQQRYRSSGSIEVSPDVQQEGD